MRRVLACNFTSSRAGIGNKIEWIWKLTNTRRDSLGTRETSTDSKWFFWIFNWTIVVVIGKEEIYRSINLDMLFKG